MKLIAVCGLLAISSNAYSQIGVAIHVRPPHPIQESVVVAPHAGMVWQPGYQRWDVATKAYIWMPGLWVDAPHVGAVWIRPHYLHRRGHWEFREGHWRK